MRLLKSSAYISCENFTNKNFNHIRLDNGKFKPCKDLVDIRPHLGQKQDTEICIIHSFSASLHLLFQIMPQVITTTILFSSATWFFGSTWNWSATFLAQIIYLISMHHLPVEPRFWSTLNTISAQYWSVVACEQDQLSCIWSASWRIPRLYWISRT